MITPLSKISIESMCGNKVMFDANIFMVGVTKRYSDPNFSFENMKNLYLLPLMEMFKDIIIHETVFEELDPESKEFLRSYIGDKVCIVSEGNLYDTDPQYNELFNKICNNELVNYDRRETKNKGEIYSLAYAIYHGIDYFSTKDAMVDNVVNDMSELQSIKVITFDIIVLIAYIYHNLHGNKGLNKALKSIYKSQCEDVIKRRKLPQTLVMYVEETMKIMDESIVKN